MSRFTLPLMTLGQNNLGFEMNARQARDACSHFNATMLVDPTTFKVTGVRVPTNGCAVSARVTVPAGLATAGVVGLELLKTYGPHDIMSISSTVGATVALHDGLYM